MIDQHDMTEMNRCIYYPSSNNYVAFSNSFLPLLLCIICTRFSLIISIVTCLRLVFFFFF